jgi:hypothetical protein
MGITIFQNSSMWGDKRHKPFSDYTCNKALPKEPWRHKNVSFNISALISCNFIIKNYVNRKITWYIYLLIFTKSLWLHVKHVVALTKRESEKFFVFCNYRSGLPLSTHRPVTTKNMGKYDSIGDKKEKNMCMHKTR